MTDIFSRRFPMLERALARVMEEPFTLLPRKAALRADGQPDVNALPGPDTSRPELVFSAAWSAEHEDKQGHGTDRGFNYSSKVEALAPSLDAAASAFSTLPQRGDLVRRPRTGRVYRVESALPDEMGRIRVVLTDSAVRL